MGSDLGTWGAQSSAKRTKISQLHERCASCVEKRNLWSCIRGISSFAWPRVESQFHSGLNQRGTKSVKAGSAQGIDILSSLAEDELRHILLWLDLQTFALAVAPSCRFFGKLINSEAFEGWLLEIKRLHSVSPWVSKTSFEEIMASSRDLQEFQYRASLRALDRAFIVSGWSVVSQDLRQLCVTSIPPFFKCHRDSLLYCCKACGSFVAPVDFTVGRGVMRQQEPAFIMQPNPTMPLCCGVQQEKQMWLSSGSYILVDLLCPNGNCDANLGWKYQNCVPEDGPVPSDNLCKIGQFWMFAESLQVVAALDSLPGCTGRQFYYGMSFQTSWTAQTRFAAQTR